MLDKFVDKLPVYDTHEIKENLANIVITLDEKHFHLKQCIIWLI